MKKAFALIFILFLTASTFAQSDTLLELYGKVINAETLKPVPYAFVLNINKRFGTKTDTAGKFRIILTPGDIIKISSLGFESYTLKPNISQAKQGRINTIIYLKPIAYKLGNVDIYSIRWKTFVNEVANTEIKEDPTQERISIWIQNVLARENLKNISDLSRGTGIVIPLPLHSKRERELKKLAKLKQREQLEKEINKKFNKNIVAKITGLKGKELDKFMEYCNFDREFILKTSEYDLITIIKDLYQEYREQQNN